MTKEELEKLSSVFKKIGNIDDFLSYKFYDFEKVELDEEFLHFLLSDKIELELNKLNDEKMKQDSILFDAKNHVAFRYPQCHILGYKCEITEYEKYYFVKIVGSPFGKVELIYYKNEKLLNFVSKDSGWINTGDGRNYFVLEKKNHTAFHKRVDSTGTCCANVRILDNIYSDISLIFGKDLDAKYGNLVGWISVRNNDIAQKKRVLYNYIKCSIVVPEYTDAKLDYGCFDNMVDRDNLIRIINFLSYDNHVCKLEFLIDEDGELCTDVFDFDKDICYWVNKDGRSQSDILNAIYEEAMNSLIREVNEKGYSKVKKCWK